MSKGNWAVTSASYGAHGFGPRGTGCAALDRVRLPVVLHVDRQVDRKVFQAFCARLKNDPLVQFSRRHRCEWGTWGIVEASRLRPINAEVC